MNWPGLLLVGVSVACGLYAAGLARSTAGVARGMVPPVFLAGALAAFALAAAWNV